MQAKRKEQEVDLVSAERLARQIMDQHNLTDWRFKFDRATRRFGLCNHSHKTINLSAPLVQINEEARVVQTIRHEVAHALAGHHAGHGPKWQRICLEIGGNGERCYDEQSTNTLTTKWTGECPKCGRLFHRERLSAGLRAGAWCRCVNGTGNDALAIRWRQNR